MIHLHSQLPLVVTVVKAESHALISSVPPEQRAAKRRERQAQLLGMIRLAEFLLWPERYVVALRRHRDDLGAVHH